MSLIILLLVCISTIIIFSTYGITMLIIHLINLKNHTPISNITSHQNITYDCNYSGINICFLISMLVSGILVCCLLIACCCTKYITEFLCKKRKRINDDF